MRKPWLVVVGVVVAMIGLVWALQGFGVLGGSAMSGISTWAVIGTLVLIGGGVLVVVGARGASRRS